METAADVIKSALQELLVQASESPLEPSEYQDGIKYLNRMMAGYSVKGINLGYTKVTNIADPITVDDGALEGIVFNLALKLAPQYGAQVPQMLYENAKDGRKAMLRLSVNVKPSQYPDTLPMGSGNQNGSYYYQDNFYPDNSKPSVAELSMANNTVETVIAAANTPVIVAGTFVIDKTHEITATSSGVCTIDFKRSNNMRVLATFRVSSASDVSANAHIYVNGQSVAQSPISATIEPVSVVLLVERTFTYQDVVTLYVENTTDTTNLTVTDSTLRIS
tara:strand:+ start:174 stop:1004 length:831 start_codon:yes stop_codon:yes gene_type:complete